jgi:chromosome partitioning protein
MPKIISFISRKGGTGKTTNAINLAAMLHSLGHKVSLIETDTNYTLNTLRKLELYKTGANDKNMFQIIPSEDYLVADSMGEYKKSMFDYIILDTAGKTTDVYIKSICVNSDIVVVPTSLSQNDLLVTYQTIEDLKPARELNTSLKIAVLPNRIHGSTKSKTINASLKELDAILLKNFVPSKNVYTQFSTIMPEKEYLGITKEIVNLFN